MSLAEIKESIMELTLEERLDVLAWIIHLNRAEDRAHISELDVRMAAMDSGKKGPSADFEQANSVLRAQGK